MEFHLLLFILRKVGDEQKFKKKFSCAMFLFMSVYFLTNYKMFCFNFRDTTVQTLTLQPSVKDGLIVYEDSPLVSNLTI